MGLEAPQFTSAIHIYTVTDDAVVASSSVNSIGEYRHSPKHIIAYDPEKGDPEAVSVEPSAQARQVIFAVPIEGSVFFIENTKFLEPQGI